MAKQVIDFYTDGAFSRKSNMGGWAVLQIQDDQIVNKKVGYEPYTTGNRMEITAFLNALMLMDALIKQNRIKDHELALTIYTDSAYVANTFNQGWFRNWLNNGWKTADKQPIKNQDLWGPVIALYIKINARQTLIIKKIPGHAGVKYNELVDDLAVEQRIVLEEKIKAIGEEEATE